VGRYIDGLISALSRTDTPVAIVCQRADAERYGRLAPDARIVPGPAAIAHRPARLAWEQTGLALAANEVEADVVHSPLYTMPLRSGRPVVVTVHDATVFSDPDLHAPSRGTFLRSATRTALRRAARVIVPSHATHDALVGELGADPDRVDVVPHGVDHERFHVPSVEERDRVSARLGLSGHSYLAVLSPLVPRKNIPALLRGWADACKDREDPPVLVLAGSTGWDREVDEALAEIPDTVRAVRPGYLREQDLAGFFGGALLFAQPSLGEGFGLPVLEAMACGAPVLTTRRLSLPEVGGDAVAYTETDPASIAKALAELLDDEHRRSELAAAGQVRATGFSWDASAALHLESYAKAHAARS
jgi:glycosyltransferase involved in cell wall biosynthesis